MRMAEAAASAGHTYLPMDELLTLTGRLLRVEPQLLQTHLTGDTPTIAQRLYPNADWRYHIQPAAQEVSV